MVRPSILLPLLVVAAVWAGGEKTPPETDVMLPVTVRAPGAYEAPALEIHLRFVSRVDDVTSAELQALAMRILNHPAGWNRSGFSFVADPFSELTVILAEGPEVDELCLPLVTYGTVNCQNGSVVALNADRWRRGGEDWNASLAAYRTYVVTHEVGHLVGLRHPTSRCANPARISATMEPQTNSLGDCRGNGIPLEWEITWAARRPAVVGPDPEWDGPRPQWPIEERFVTPLR